MPGKFVDFVNDKVKGNKVAVFSKTYCPYCDMAKTALKDAGLKNYLLIELDKVEDGSAIQDALLEITGGRTVPRVFIGGKFVGGGSEVRDLQAAGKLKPMLQDAGAM
ncbi:hypothetical protein ACROYT_G034023 [Oculina patagonica]